MSSPPKKMRKSGVAAVSAAQQNEHSDEIQMDEDDPASLYEDEEGKLCNKTNYEHRYFQHGVNSINILSGGYRVGDIYIPPPIKPYCSSESQGARLIITQIMNTNFKSYAGDVPLGPFCHVSNKFWTI